MEKVATLITRFGRLLVLLAGGVSATGFAPLGLWPLTLLCLALLMHLVARADTGKNAFLIGWLFGIGHFSVGNNWIATAFTFQDAMPAWLGWIAVVLLSLYLAVYPALAAWGAWWIAKRVDSASISLPFVLAFAGCWIVTEWLRAWVFTGYSWNPLAVVMLSDSNAPLLIRWVGTYGSSGLIIALIGAYLWTWKLLKTRGWSGWRHFLIWVIAPVLWMAPLGALHSWSDNNAIFFNAKANLTIVQPNISQTVKHVDGYEAVNFSRLARHSRPLDNQPRLLLWPEAAIPWWLEDGYPRHVYFDQPGSSAAGTRALLARLLGPDDILLTGTDLLEYTPEGKLAGARNSMLAMDAQGDIRARYDKAHLVPFGEYLALRWLLEPLGATRLVPGAIDFLPGPGPRTLDLGAGRPKVGMQICYEIIFSGQVVDRANRPDFIFNPSNDAWFGGWGSPQFVAQSRLRAIEEGLPVVRATPTGISAVIDADGRVVESLPTGKAGRIDAMLPVAKAPTLFARFGNILPLGFAALLIVLAFMPLARARASR